MRSLLILMIVLSGSVLADDQFDQKVIRYIFNAEWQVADSLLDHKINTDPDNPHYPFLKMQHYFYTRYWNAGALNGDSLMQLCADNARKTIELARNIEDTPDGKFYLGSANGFLSRYHVRRSEMWDGFWAAREASNYLKDVIESNPEYYDAYVELAVQEYFTATRLNNWMSALAWMVGMSGNREIAFDYFAKAAENGRIRKAEARFALAAIYRFFEYQYDESLRLTRLLVNDYPDNPFLLAQLQQVQFMKDIESTGVQNLAKMHHDSLRTRFQINNAAVLNNLGYNFINQNRYDDAIMVLKLNIELYPAIANGYDSISECYQLLEDNENALKYAKAGLEKLAADTTLDDENRDQLRTLMETRIEDVMGEISI